jgi:small subunit ribosomal protein S11
MPREVVKRIFSAPVCSSCRRQILNASSKPQLRPFSASSLRRQDEPSSPAKPPSTGLAGALLSHLGDRGTSPAKKPSGDWLAIDQLLRATDKSMQSQQLGSGSNLLRTQYQEPHHLHIYATKHNTHITLTRPNKDAIISLSAGNLGFRKAQRGSYDAAFQLAAYVMRNMQEKGLLRRGYDDSARETIQGLEVVFRGFGQGREAVRKALLGNEGRNLRDRVVKVSDATRLKFGGTRSQNPRRLG